jgi:hypothetical protein
VFLCLTRKSVFSVSYRRLKTWTMFVAALDQLQAQTIIVDAVVGCQACFLIALPSLAHRGNVAGPFLSFIRADGSHLLEEEAGRSDIGKATP